MPSGRNAFQSRTSRRIREGVEGKVVGRSVHGSGGELEIGSKVSRLISSRVVLPRG